MKTCTVAIFVIVLLPCVPFFCNGTEIFDLTWDFDNDTVYYSGVTPITYRNRLENEDPWYAMQEFCAGEHGGTHVDPPYHFNESGWKVGDIPVERLIVQGAVIDMSTESAGTDLQPNHLTEWVAINGDFEENTAILVKFGWSKLWLNRTAYLGLDPTTGKMDFPGVSREAASWIKAHGKIVGVGVDTSSVDPGSCTDFWAHRILSSGLLYNIENVKMVEELPGIYRKAIKINCYPKKYIWSHVIVRKFLVSNIPNKTGTSIKNPPKLHMVRNFTLLVMPMKLKEGTGAPARVVALLL